MENKWFGPAISAPVCEALDHVPEPVGEQCVMCERPIVAGDRGLMIVYLGGFAEPASLRAIHHSCLLQNIGVTPREA